MVRRAVSALLALAAVGMTAAAVSSGDAVHLTSSFDFETRPSKGLPRTAPAPVWMELAGSYRADDGSHVPAATKLRFLADRHLGLDLEGIPGCELPFSRSRLSPGELEDLCRESIVGRGEISAEVEFPGQPRSRVNGRTVAVKPAGSSADVDLVLHAFLPAPVTAEFAIPIGFRPVNRGRIGWEAQLSIPKIAGDYGSLTGYSLRIGKRFLSATCVGERLELRAVTFFADGVRSGERAVRRCTVAKADVRQ